MIEQRSLSDQHIIDCLNTDYGIAVVKLKLLPLGADMNASVYKAQAHDGSSYFVKVKRGHNYDISVIIPTLLQDAGINQLIPPIKTTTDDLLVQHTEGFTIIVYPFVEGLNGFSHNLTDEEWFTLGKVLKQIHEFEVPLAIQDKIRREDYSPKWRELVRALLTQIDAEPTGDEITLKLVAFMKMQRSAIHRLVNRAEELAQMIRQQPFAFVLCHSDIHGGNVLISGKGVIYIVDFDEPIMAPKERDLMFIGGGVANVWNNPREEEIFYKGYGKTAINMAILAYYRHERIVEDIALYAQELLLKAAHVPKRMESYKQFIAML